MEFMIEVKAVPDKFQELYQTLQALIPTIRKVKGCRECHVSRDIEDGEVFFLFVDWETMDNLEEYAISGNCSALLGAIDLLGERTRLRLGKDSPWGGIDILKRIRKSRSLSFK